MADLLIESVLKEFALYFDVPIKGINLKFDNKVPVVQFAKNISNVYGFRNVVAEVIKKSSLENNTIQDQWLEYILKHSGNYEVATNLQILKELNDYLGDHVFFVTNIIGPVDLIMYYFLYKTMLNLTFQQKEQFLNVSRWFNNIQQNKNIRFQRPFIYFSKTLLYS